MFKNYFKTALRNLLRHRVHSIINITGLLVGFAAFLLIALVIQYEESFDTFHTNKNNIYRVNRIGKNITKGEFRAGVPFPVAPGLRMDFPQLKNVAAIFANDNVQVDVPAPNGNILKKFKEPTGVFLAEPQFFTMFDFPLASGNLSTALNEPNTALITKATAIKYFGDWKSAVDKTLSMDGSNVKITGVLENPPSNTDFPIKIVISYTTLGQDADVHNQRSWGNISDENYAFVQLPSNYQPQQFEEMMKGFVDKHIASINPNYDLQLQPLKELHYDDRFGNFNRRTFSKDLILALSLIALFLIIMASVNFINLTTAQAVSRAREVGVRKVMGGRRGQLVLQFLGETGITCLVALLGSVLVAFICVPFLNNLLDIHIARSILISTPCLVFLLATLVCVTLFSGFYPAIVLSRFNPVAVLKSALLPQRGKGISLRRGLVVFQFVIAQGLIISTLVVASQMDYFKNADMGFQKAAILNANFPNDSLSRTKVALLRDQILEIPGVQGLSFSVFRPAGGGNWATDLEVPTNHTHNPDLIVSMKPADTNYFRIYGLQLVAGRMYFPSDTSAEYVVNETLVSKLGYAKPADGIGKLIRVNGALLPIVGVVKDFHINSLRDVITPVVMTTMKGAYQMANIKIVMSNAKEITAAMERIWSQDFPGSLFEYSFLDKTVEEYYKQENELSQLYKIFSAIAIIISCLGLYGLISFIAVRRKKEIGIRKVLGAPVRDIIVMLSREFTLLIGIGFIIAAPIAWYFMHQWLQHYAYKIEIGVGFFILTLLASVFIAWLTIGYTCIRAALANPADSLRTE